MTRKEAIIARAKEAEKETTFSDIVLEARGVCSAFGIGYLEGAEWADEHPNIIWHDSNVEQPTPMSRVVILDEYDNIDVLTNVLEVFENRRWAYIDNLLPKN